MFLFFGGGHALIVKSRHVNFLHQTLQEPTAAPKTTAGVPISACPIPEVGSVSVGGASTRSMQLPVWWSLTAPQGRRPATMGVSVWAAAGCATAVWTVRTSRMSGTVSLEFLESPKCGKSKLLTYLRPSRRPACRIITNFTSGPDTNSASSRAKTGVGRPPQSPSSPPPTGQNVAVLSVKDAPSCDLQRCHNHGSCVTEGEVTRCHCVTGYKGESCEEAETGRSHAPIVLGVLFLITVLMAAAFILFKRYRMWGCFPHLHQTQLWIQTWLLLMWAGEPGPPSEADPGTKKLWWPTWVSQRNATTRTWRWKLHLVWFKWRRFRI